MCGFVLYFPDGARWGLGEWFNLLFCAARPGPARTVSAVAGEFT